MTYEDYQDLWWRYEFGPFRTLEKIVAVAWNVEAVMEAAKARGQKAGFWCFTMREADDEELCRKHFSIFLRRLRGKTAVCGLRVFENGRENGRFHVHAVFDRFVERPVVDECKRGLVLGHSKVVTVETDGLGRYLWKEMIKQVSRGGRRWATFGDFPGRKRAGDVVVECRYRECARMARECSTAGQSRQEIREQAQWLYWNTGIGEPVEPGDAHEDAGGVVDFDPSEWES